MKTLGLGAIPIPWLVLVNGDQLRQQHPIFVDTGVHAYEKSLADLLTLQSQRAEVQTSFVPPVIPLHQHLTVVYHSEIDVPPVSTAVQCIINLLLQYFVVFAALAICRQFFKEEREPEFVVSTLEAACSTVTYAPMLCILFLAARMRALQITDGGGNPQYYVRLCMQVATWAILFQTILVVLYPFITGKKVEVDNNGNLMTRRNISLHADVDDDGNLMAPQGGNKDDMATKIIKLLKNIALLGVWGGMVAVCVGTILMSPQTLGFPTGKPIPVSPAVQNVISLTFQFIFVCGMNMLMGMLQMGKWASTFCLAVTTVHLAPMLCILFVSFRMRAVSLHRDPQVWAQTCMYICTYAMLVYTIMTVILPILGAEFQNRSPNRGLPGVPTFPNRTMNTIWQSTRTLVLFIIYAMLVVVVVSMLVITTEENGVKEPPMSTAVLCCVVLCAQYFFVHTGVYIIDLLMAQTQSEKRPPAHADQNWDDRQYQRQSSLDVWHTLFDNMRNCTQFSTMLCVLFIATRMRALQITDQLGQPQGWAQEAMLLCTFCLVLQLITIFLVFLFAGSKASVDADGNVRLTDEMSVRQSHFKEDSLISSIVDYILIIQKWVCLLGIYVGAVIIIVSIFEIKSEVANGCDGFVLECPKYKYKVQ